VNAAPEVSVDRADRVELVAICRANGANGYEVKLDGKVVGWLRLERLARIGSWRDAGATPSRAEWVFEPECLGDEGGVEACERLGIEWVLCRGFDRFADIKKYLKTKLGRNRT
jgi:hypothetical protein